MSDTGISRGVEPDAVVVPKGKKKGTALPGLPMKQRGDGSVDDPSPLAELQPGVRLRRIKGILELAACHGDVSAAKELLAHHRWETEMRKGRPPTRGKLEVSRGVDRIVDDISKAVTGVDRMALPSSADETGDDDVGEEEDEGPAGA